MTSDRSVRRRAVLCGAGAAIAGLAGCVSGSTGDADTPTGTAPPTTATRTATRTARPPTDTPTDTATQTPTPEETPTPARGDPDSWTGLDKGRVLDDFQDFEDRWWVESGAATVTDHLAYGEGESVFLTSEGAERIRIRREFQSARDFSDTAFSMAVRLEGTTQSVLQVPLALRDLFGNLIYLSGTVHGQATDRWVRLDLGVLDDRGADMTAIKEVWVDEWVGDERSRFFVDDIRTHPKPDTGHVMFTFDDAHAGDYSVAFPTLDQYGYAGAVFPPTGQLSSSSNPSIDDYLEMQDAGWDVGAHGINHENLAKLSRREQKLVLERNKRELRDMGFTGGARIFRTPFNAYDGHSLDLLPRFFDASIVGAGSASGTHLEITDPRTIAFKSGDDYERAKSLIDDAAKYNQLLGLTFHMNRMSSRQAFEDLVRYVHDYQQRGELAVITPSTLLDEHMGG